MAGQAALPELVRDSRLQASLQGNVTVHTRPPGRRGISRHESWVRERILGNGGYGVVWLERKVETADKNDGSATRLRAVKCVRIPPSRSQLEGGKYVRELEALAKFSQDKYSEHFVRFYGWYEAMGSLHITMEYCEYGDLKGYLSDYKTMPETQVQDIALQVSGAISLMHSERFAHRDLKPANILIKCKPPDNWWVKVADLGLSKRAESDIASTTVRGTESFMAPETRGFPFIGNPVLANPFAADMWSLGEVIFQALSGRPTFDDPRQLLAFQKMQVGFPTSVLREVNASSTAESLVLSLMASNPYARITASEGLQHLWFAAHTESTPETPLQPVADPFPSASPFLGEITEPSGQWTATLSHRGAAPGPKTAKRASSASASRTMRPSPSPVGDDRTSVTITRRDHSESTDDEKPAVRRRHRASSSFNSNDIAGLAALKDQLAAQEEKEKANKQIPTIEEPSPERKSTVLEPPEADDDSAVSASSREGKVATGLGIAAASIGIAAGGKDRGRDVRDERDVSPSPTKGRNDDDGRYSLKDGPRLRTSRREPLFDDEDFEIIEHPKDREHPRKGISGEPSVNTRDRNESTVDHSESTDDGKPTICRRHRAFSAFNPNDIAGLAALKAQLAAQEEKEKAEKQISTIRKPSLERKPTVLKFPKVDNASTMSVSSLQDESRGRELVLLGRDEKQVRVISPLRDKDDKKPIKGIPKQPKPQFPKEPNPIREGVTPYKDNKTKTDVPSGARWTKISRKMVNPEALTIGKERFEVRDNFVIVLRVLSKEEIQAYAAVTVTLRERRLKEYRRELKEPRKHKSEEKEGDN